MRESNKLLSLLNYTFPMQCQLSADSIVLNFNLNLFIIINDILKWKYVVVFYKLNILFSWLLSFFFVCFLFKPLFKMLSGDQSHTTFYPRVVCVEGGGMGVWQNCKYLCYNNLTFINQLAKKLGVQLPTCSAQLAAKHCIHFTFLIVPKGSTPK